MNSVKSDRASIFLMFYLFAVLLNHSAIFLRLTIPLDIHLFSALIGGVFNSIFFPLLVLFTLSNFSSQNYFINRLMELAIAILCIIPFLDLLYFNVTLSRFNWSVAHDLNFYALKASFIEILNNRHQLLPLFAAFFSGAVIRYVSTVYSVPDFRKLTYHLLIGCIILKFFFPYEEIPINSNFTPIVMKIRGKNNYLAIINQGSLKNFFKNLSRASDKVQAPVIYTAQEKEELMDSGLIPVQTHDFKDKPFRRVIILVFESLALEYLSGHNPLIPPSATSFFDDLDSKFPSSHAFFTSASPTLNGLYAMLNSRIPFSRDLAEQRKEKSLVQLFKEKHACKTFFIRGVSKFYGGEDAILSNVFGFENLITYEELALRFPEPGITSWGFHDDVVLKAAEEVLLKEPEKPVFMLIKLMDLHQPPYYCGIPAKDLPEEIARHPSPIIKSIYWANKLLKDFFESLQKHSLIDDETVLIITADHYPPLGYGHLEIVKDSESNYLGKIPLIFVSSRQSAFKDLNPRKITCQLDLAPTISWLGGIKASDYFIGQNIINEKAVSRKIGLYNDLLSIYSQKFQLHEPISNALKPDKAIKKWIFNLYAR